MAIGSVFLIVLGIIIFLGFINSIKIGGVTLFLYVIGLIFCGIIGYKIISKKDWEKGTLGDLPKIRINHDHRK